MQKKQGNCDFSLEKEEVKCTPGVPMLTRYQKLPLNRINWGQQCDVTGKSVCHNTGRKSSTNLCSTFMFQIPMILGRFTKRNKDKQSV